MISVVLPSRLSPCFTLQSIPARACHSKWKMNLKFTYVYIGMGPEFFNNMDSANNVFGAEDSKAWKYVTRAHTLHPQAQYTAKHKKGNL